MAQPMMTVSSQQGSLLDRRWLVQAKIMLDGTVPLLVGVAQNIEPDNLMELDKHLPSIRQLFEIGLQVRLPPYNTLCVLLKQLNKYLNLRGLYTDQVAWAQSLLRHFLDNADETGDTIDLAIVNTIASGYDSLGQHQEAFELYEFMLDLYEDHPGLGVVCFNAALAQFRQGNANKALEFCNRALEIDECYGNNTGQAATILLIADLLDMEGDSQAIFDNLRSAIELLEHSRNDHLRAQITAKLAFYSAKYADWTIAEPLFHQSIEVWRTIGDDEQLAGVLFNYANLLYETGRISEALTNARESYQLFQRHNIYHLTHVEQTISTWQSESDATVG